MEKAATGIYAFENLRKGGFTYVDKTAILKKLADLSRGKQFFIARVIPRASWRRSASSSRQPVGDGRRRCGHRRADERASCGAGDSIPEPTGGTYEFHASFLLFAVFLLVQRHKPSLFPKKPVA